MIFLIFAITAVLGVWDPTFRPKTTKYKDRVTQVVNARKPGSTVVDQYRNRYVKNKCAPFPDNYEFRRILKNMAPAGCQEHLFTDAIINAIRDAMTVQAKAANSGRPIYEMRDNPQMVKMASLMNSAGLFKGANAFWSGGGPLSDYAYTVGDMPLEWTEMGKCMNTNPYFMFDGTATSRPPWSPSTSWKNCPQQFWNAVSHQFALNMSGPVYIYMRVCDYGKILWRQEIPQLPQTRFTGVHVIKVESVSGTEDLTKGIRLAHTTPNFISCGKTEERGNIATCLKNKVTRDLHFQCAAGRSVVDSGYGSKYLVSPPADAIGNYFLVGTLAMVGVLVLGAGYIAKSRFTDNDYEAIIEA